MRTRTTYIVLGLLVVLGVLYLFYRYEVSKNDFAPIESDSTEFESTMNEQEEKDQNSTVNETDATNTIISEPVTIDSSKLTDGQKKLLNMIGIDTESFVITPKMTKCAETKIGSARLQEIISGTTPSFKEGIALYSCYSE